MKIISSLLFLTLTLTAKVVLAEDIATCAGTPYYPSKYTCFNGNFLCPIQADGTPTLQCGTACYSQSQYSCPNGQLVLNDPNQPNALSCGGAPYYPSQYVCFDSTFLCPVLSGKPTLRCGDACYNYDQYKCENGQLKQIPSTCKAQYDYCYKDGMSFACCSGLICVANRCRDPCQLRPESCGKV